MNNLLKYKEFFGDVEFSDDCLHGKIIGINDLITYESENIAGLKKAFEEAVDDYLEMCKSIGKAPEKSYRGTFNI